MTEPDPDQVPRPPDELSIMTTQAIMPTQQADLSSNTQPPSVNEGFDATENELRRQLEKEFDEEVLYVRKTARDRVFKANKERDVALLQVETEKQAFEAKLKELSAESETKFAESEKKRIEAERQRRELEAEYKSAQNTHILELSKVRAELKAATKSKEKVAAGVYTELVTTASELSHLDNCFAQAAPPKELRRSTDVSRYTQEDMAAVYAEGKLIGQYEHEITDDLRASVKYEPETFENDPRVQFLMSSENERHPYQVGRKIGHLVCGGFYAFHMEAEACDMRMVKLPGEPHYPVCPKEKRDTYFWRGYIDGTMEAKKEIDEFIARRDRRRGALADVHLCLMQIDECMIAFDQW